MAPCATLYTTPNLAHPRSIKIKAIASLNNLELHIPADFTFGVTNKSTAYLAKFPLGRIPALEVTATGFLLTEASAIAAYVAECGPRRESLLGRTSEERALVGKWVSFGDMHIYPTVTALVTPLLSIPGISRAVSPAELYDGKEADLKAELESWLKCVDDELCDGRRWLLPDTQEVSMADISLAGVLKLGMKYYVNGELRAKYPAFARWYKRVVCVGEIAEAFGDCGLLGGGDGDGEGLLT